MFQNSSDGIAHVLVPMGEIRNRIGELVNRLSFNAGPDFPVCGFLVEISDTSIGCMTSPVTRTNLPSQVVPSTDVLSGPGYTACSSATTNAFLNNEGGCLSRFRQLVAVDCDSGDQRAYGIVVIPTVPSAYKACGILSPRSCQPLAPTAVYGFD